MTQKLVLVNKNDKIIGFDTKEKCHEGKGLLHRAFSVYIFNNKDQLLIQKRSRFKNLWPLCWTNSCCSHPHKDEDYVVAGERRVREELGIECRLRMVDQFQYQAKYKNKGSENELCAILLGRYNGKINANTKEIDSWKWISIDRLKKDIEENPSEYTPWFKIGIKRYLKKKKAFIAAKDKMADILHQETLVVDPVIKKVLKNYVDNKFHKLVEYQISVGGKRLRPALATISCRLLGGKAKDVSLPAAGLEILHNYTLIVDDIIDHSSLRRNKPTTWAKFGQSMAECISMYYAAAIYETAAYFKNPFLISEIFSKALKTIIDGEILDVLFEQGGRKEEPYVLQNRYHNITEREYYKMVSKKTAALFEASCEIGAVCAGASKKQINAIKEYGLNLGLAFQIQDDLLDIFGDEKKFGKKIGKDIEERKLGNIVILLSVNKLPEAKKTRLLRIINKNHISQKDIEGAMKLIKEAKSYQKVDFLVESFLKKAKNSLKVLPQNKWNKLLLDLADFVVQREN